MTTTTAADNNSHNTAAQQMTASLVESFQQQDRMAFTPKELYRLGCVLHQLDVLQVETIKHDVQSAYHELLQGLPRRQKFFDVLHQGLATLLQNDGQSQQDDVITAVEAMDSLYRFSILADASHESTIETLKLLAKYHNQHFASASSSQLSSSNAILSLVSRLLWKSPSHTSLEWDELIPVLDVLQEENVWKPLTNYLDENATGSWQEAWLDGYTDETQREYLSSWLAAAAGRSEREEAAAALAQAISKQGTSSKSRPVKKTAVVGTDKDPLQRQLDQVRAILPQYGEGLVELALSLRHGNVEETVSLLSSPAMEWPMALRNVDPALPRRHKKRVAGQDQDVNAITKEAIRAADRQEELEAQIMAQFETTNEYDDDYDDQWDGVADTAGANDTGLYDDFQAVRTYNRVVRENEKEAAFWQENANTNRRATKGESRYRGPDKIKGGRIPKPPPASSAEPDAPQGKEQTDKDDTSKNGNKKAGHGKKDAPVTKESGKKDAGKQPSTDGKPSRAAQRQKERKMANRKEKQRMAMNKRSG